MILLLDAAKTSGHGDRHKSRQRKSTSVDESRLPKRKKNLDSKKLFRSIIMCIKYETQFAKVGRRFPEEGFC